MNAGKAADTGKWSPADGVTEIVVIRPWTPIVSGVEESANAPRKSPQKPPIKKRERYFISLDDVRKDLMVDYDYIVLDRLVLLPPMKAFERCLVLFDWDFTTADDHALFRNWSLFENRVASLELVSTQIEDTDEAFFTSRGVVVRKGILRETELTSF